MADCGDPLCGDKSIRERTELWPLGEERKLGCDFYAREVAGTKKKRWSHDPDRVIQIRTDDWVTITMEQQAILIERVALAEDRLYPHKCLGHKGGAMFFEMINDIPLLTATGAYQQDVQFWRNLRNSR